MCKAADMTANIVLTKIDTIMINDSFGIFYF